MNEETNESHIVQVFQFIKKFDLCLILSNKTNHEEEINNNFLKLN